MEFKTLDQVRHTPKWVEGNIKSWEMNKTMYEKRLADAKARKGNFANVADVVLAKMIEWIEKDIKNCEHIIENFKSELKEIEEGEV